MKILKFNSVFISFSFEFPITNSVLLIFDIILVISFVSSTNIVVFKEFSSWYSVISLKEFLFVVSEEKTVSDKLIENSVES